MDRSSMRPCLRMILDVGPAILIGIFVLLVLQRLTGVPLPLARAYTKLRGSVQTSECIPNGPGTPFQDGQQVSPRGLGRLRGAVRAPDRRPMGARLQAGLEGETLPRASTVCADDGAFFLHVAAGTWWIFAEIDGFVGGLRGIVVAKGAEREVEVQLVQGGVITGQVTGAGCPGLALDSVTLITTAIENAEGRRMGDDRALWRQVQTDATGRFRVAVTAGRHGLSAERLGFGMAVSTVWVEPGAEVQCDLVLPEPRRLSGTVRDVAGKPVPDARVDLDCFAGGRVVRQSVRSGEHGGFEYKDRPEGRCALRCYARGFAVAERWVRADETDIPIVLGRGGRVEGKVVRLADGSSIPGPIVQCQVIVEPDLTIVSVEAAVAEDGSFVIDSVPEGRCMVQACAEGYAAGHGLPFDLVAGQTVRDVVVGLTQGGTLRGTVLRGASRRPVAGADVMYLRVPGPDVPGFLPGGSTGDRQVTSDSEGRFEILHLAPGLYQLLVDDGVSFERPRLVRIDEGGIWGEEFVLCETGSLIVRVLGRDGRELIGAEVEVWAPSGRPLQSRTGTDGVCEFGSLPMGDCTVTVSAPDGGTGAKATWSTKVEEGGRRECTFSLAGGARVFGRVLSDGRPRAGTTVRVVSQDDRTWKATTDSEGRFEFPALPVGEYTAAVGWRFQSLDVPNGISDLRLDIDLPAGVIAGRAIRAGTTEAIGGLAVAAVPQNDSSMHGEARPAADAKTVTGPDGSFCLEGLAEGTFVVVVTNGGRRVAESWPIVLRDGEAIRSVDIAVSAGARVWGVLRDVAGRPIPLADIDIRDGSPRGAVSSASPEKSDGQGRFQIADVAPGEHTLVVEAAGYCPVWKRVSVPAGGLDALAITLQRAGVVVVDVRDALGGPVSSAQVNLARETSETPVSSTDLAPDRIGIGWWSESDGRAACEGIPAGWYSGTVECERGTGRFRVEVQEDRISRITCTLQAR